MAVPHSVIGLLFVLFQQLVFVSTVTGAVFEDSCNIDASLPVTTSLKLSTTQSSYVPGQSVTVRLSSTSGVTNVDELLIAGRSAASTSTSVVGRFDKVLPSGVELACNGSAVVQKNTTLRTLQLTWNAPLTTGLGQITFIANVAINGSKFSIISDDVIPEVTSDAIDTSSCGQTKLCMRDPAGCDGGSCDWLMTSRDVGMAYDIELSATVTQTNAWVAFGLSYDYKMGFDSIVDCIHDAATNKINIQLSWSGRGIDNDPVPGRFDVLVEKSLSGSYVDGRITCRFYRLKQPLRNDSQLYLLNNSTEYFVLLARGPSMAGEKYYHNRRIRSESAFYFNESREVDTIEDPSVRLKLVKAHGILMLLAWMVFASFAILMPRYCKQAWPGKTLLDKQIWFRIHQPCMLATFVLTSIGFILVFVAVKRYSKLVSPTDGHPPCGIIVMILCFINPIMAFFRPEPTAERRPIFNWLHFIVGELAHIFAVITLFLAMYMVLPDLQRYVWCRAVMATYVCVHAAVEIALAIHKHRQTIKRFLHLNSAGDWDVQMDAIDSDAAPKNSSQDSDSGSTFITIVLVLHLIVVVAIFMALSVQIGIS